jgi:hypothetical protein
MAVTEWQTGFAPSEPVARKFFFTIEKAESAYLNG